MLLALVIIIYFFNKYVWTYPFARKDMEHTIHSNKLSSIFLSCFFCPDTNTSSLDNLFSNDSKKLTLVENLLLLCQSWLVSINPICFYLWYTHLLYIDTEHLFKKRRLKLPTVYCQNYLLPKSIVCDLLGTFDQVLSPSGIYFFILSLILLDINSVYWELSLSVVSWRKVLLTKWMNTT